MAKPTGFLEYTRALSPDRPPLERIKDWKEFHTAFSAEKQQVQAARCMDCGTPFCHSGLLIGGAASGCPINNLIPEWNELVYRGLWEEAAKRLLKTNNFPEFTGRVCPAPCEGSCTLGLIDPAVSIKADECEIIDYAFEQGWIKPQPPETRTGKKVAVIGSGPSGLACAAQLNYAGHSVTVFERADRPGGLLMYGIPNMKLDKQRVLRRVKLMEDEGVTFKTGVEVGKDLDAQSLLADFDAVVLCTGATKPRDLSAERREGAEGIHFAVDFLHANTKSLLDSELKDGSYISAKDKHVIVIGGGDTGTDCVATSIRHGCKSIVQFEIMPKPSADRTAGNPWPEWPKIFRTDYGQEEADAVFGGDPRTYGVMTTKVETDDAGHIRALDTVQVEWKKDAKSGRFSPVPVSGSEKTWQADLVLIAMGFLGPEQALLDDLGIERTARSNVNASEADYATNIPGIFAAGDARRGQSLVVWGIHEGRAAAAACDRYLTNQ
ncbi:MAG: glutamate synthase subunit beta [Ethanoligenens sp.]